MFALVLSIPKYVEHQTILCSTLILRQLWNHLPPEAKDKMLADVAQKLLVKHVAGPDEIAEAYLFLMKYVFEVASLRIY